MRLYFVRHGESDLNKRQTHQYPEVTLSETGLRQAKQVAERCKNVPIDVILSSDLPRAKQTTEEITAATGKQSIFTPLLRERRRPSVIHGKLYKSDEAIKMIKQLHKHRHDSQWRHSDEENFFDIIKRVKKFLSLVEKRNEKDILVVTHAAFLKYFLTYMLYGDQAGPDHFEQLFFFFVTNNTGITIFEKKIDPYYTEKIQWHLITWNDHAHLG